MAILTQVITGSINMFGASRTSNWGTMQWASASTWVWGEGTLSMEKTIEKGLGNTITASDAYVAGFGKLISNSLPVTSDMTEMTMIDANGYSYIFLGGVTNSDDRAEVDYNEPSDPGSSWTSATASTTSWSSL